MVVTYRDYHDLFFLKNKKDTSVSYTCYKKGRIELEYFDEHELIKEIDVYPKETFFSTKYYMSLVYHNPYNGFYTQETIEISKE